MRVSDVGRILNVLNDSFNHGYSPSEQVELVALPILNWHSIEDITTSDIESLIDDRILKLISQGEFKKA
jgi:hypothetical protein